MNSHNRPSHKYKEVAPPPKFQRQKNNKQPHKRYLVVCEGAKTEPYYFQGLKNHLLTQKHTQESKVLIEIETSHNGNSPDQILQSAQERYKESIKEGNAYDGVACVFDRDCHETFVKTLERITQLRQKPKNPLPFLAITSTPCFEFWLLLHFGYTDRPYGATPTTSVGEQAKEALRKQPGFENYQKYDKDIYNKLLPKLNTAKKHAAQLRKNAHPHDAADANPWTNVDVLVNALINTTTPSPFTTHAT